MGNPFGFMGTTLLENRGYSMNAFARNSSKRIVTTKPSCLVEQRIIAQISAFLQF
jgi:hypothetical protein